MRVHFINNAGQGFADDVTIVPGMTISEFFRSQMAGANAKNYIIQVNGASKSGGYVLNDGDRISVTPSKIQGARCVRRFRRVSVIRIAA